MEEAGARASIRGNQGSDVGTWGREARGRGGKGMGKIECKKQERRGEGRR